MFNILDTTIRDGSYIVNFKWKKTDIINIVKNLDQCNIPYIEVGHGLGLGAYRLNQYRSSLADIEQLQIARDYITSAKWGMFYIPKIGSLEDIDLAVEHGMKFIRIGTDVTDLDASKSAIEYAKNKGLLVFSNLMKTYALPPKEVAKRVKMESDRGADVVVIVDSAGGMLPEDLIEYSKYIREFTSVPLGFHGHNNLNLAIANSMVAAEYGFRYVDTTLRGMGRSAGNTSTEQLLLIFQKKGYLKNIDPIKILRIAEKYVDPILSMRHLNDSMSIISGYAQFHSSYTPIIEMVSKGFHVDPRELIVKVSEIDKINITLEMTEKAASNMKPYIESQNEIIDSIPFDLSCKSDINYDEKINNILNQLFWLSQRNGHKSVVNLVKSSNGNVPLLSTNIFSGKFYSLVTFEYYDNEMFNHILQLIHEEIDYILVDLDKQSNYILDDLSKFVKTDVMYYSDSQVLSKTINRMVLEKTGFPNKELHVISIGNTANLSSKITSFFETVGIPETNIQCENFESVCLEYQSSCVVLLYDVGNLDLGIIFDKISKLDFVIDCTINNLESEIVERLRDRAINVYRPDMRLALHDEVQYIDESNHFYNNIQGVKEVQNIEVVAGGVIGKKNAVVVDQINNPSTIIGISDGTGKLFKLDGHSAEQKKLVDSIKLYFSERDKI